MTDRYTFANFRLYTLLIALISSSILFGCEKESLDSPPSEQNSFNALRVEFSKTGYEKELVRSFNDTANIHWEANWRAGYNKIDPKGVIYTYVPLTPVLRSKKAPHQPSPFKMLGVKMFVLIKHSESINHFILATYIANLPQKESPAIAAAKPFNYSNFSGILLLNNLSTNENARLVYDKGLMVKQAVRQPIGVAKGQNTDNKFLSSECYNYYTCYWSLGCRDRNGNYITYGTTTSGIEDCWEPTYEPCGDWGTHWTSNGYDIEPQCHYVEDPPDPYDPSGGGDDTTALIPGWDALVIPSSGPKINPRDENKCFDISKGAKITIYVQQPVPGTDELNGGDYGIGHTFIGIEQNGITRYMGYYPQTGANRAAVGLNISYDGEIRDNSGEVYHVSISSSVNSNQLGEIINYINNYPATYTLNNYNCSDFGIAVGNLAGMNLPATTTSAMWGMFNGRSPGVLGQDIRAKSPPNNGSINTNGGTAPTKQGSCP